MADCISCCGKSEPVLVEHVDKPVENVDQPVKQVDQPVKHIKQPVKHDMEKNNVRADVEKNDVVLADATNMFCVSMVVLPKSGVGLDLDVLDDSGIMVSKVLGGAIHRWNSQADPDLQVRHGDRIIEVNGARGCSQDLLVHLRDEGCLKMWFKRPVVVRISADTSLKPVGLVVAYTHDGSTLLIHDVEEGFVEDWSKENPELAVHKNDRIVAVNGTTGFATNLMLALRLALRLQMKLELVLFCYNIQ